jgi:hypothetical protein
VIAPCNEQASIKIRTATIRIGFFNIRYLKIGFGWFRSRVPALREDLPAERCSSKQDMSLSYPAWSGLDS